MPRTILSANDAARIINVKADNYDFEKIKTLHANLALPSYVHGYSLAIQYMYNWFRSKFPEDFFRGGIYIDGKNVLDDYRRLNDYSMKNIIKGQNPRARMEPRVEFEYDREGIDFYQGPPQTYLRRSKFEDSFFKDYDNDLFLGFRCRELRMNVNYRVRVNSRAQQLDTFNRMELYFRNGATQYEYVSVDFHIPKYIILSIAQRAAFEVKDGEVVDIIEFIQYLNRHSNYPFLFKLRAINQQPEYFIRVNDVYAHVAVRDKLQLDDGERDGKLDFNFQIEMNTTLEMAIPHFFSFYSAEDFQMPVLLRENNEGCVAIYSINILDIPKVDEHGWGQIALTDYQIDKGDEDIDIAPIFGGSNVLTDAIHDDLAVGISPSKYINIKVYKDDDIAKTLDFKIDWEKMKLLFKNPEEEGVAHIVIYYDREYINNNQIAKNNLYQKRIKNNPNNPQYDKDHDKK